MTFSDCLILNTAPRSEVHMKTFAAGVLSIVIGVAVSFVCTISAAHAQPSPARNNFVHLVVPEADTVIADSWTYRLSAGTAPGNKLTLNGSPLKVYPTGAVAGLLTLHVGENPFTLTATGPAGDSVSKAFLVIRKPPPETTPDSVLAIDTIMTEPSVDLWLDEDDRLDVQIKGTPGCKASCDLGIPMNEVKPAYAGGLGGIYRGYYMVRDGDTLTSHQIRFRLENASGAAVEAVAKGAVTMRPNDFPYIGITRGERPALAYGLGEDRLGGAKLSFINPGIRLAITGKHGNQYRVALSPGREAWIATPNVELIPRGARLPAALTGNCLVYGDEKYDYVTVALPLRLPYSSTTESDPTRIHVDVYGATSNTNWIIQQLSTREIRNVYYTEPSKGVFRLTIELRHKQIWGYEIGYNPGGLLVKVRRQPEKLKIRALTFALDAGHGGDNLGALGSTGVLEKDINLAVVKELKALLEDRGARVVLTRDSDTDIAMAERVRKVIASDADILISIHSNSIGLTTNPEDTRGTATFYKHICYRPLAMAVLKDVLKTGLPLFGNVGSFNFSLNSPTELPNVLVEMAFVSNPLDEMSLIDPEFRHRIAKRIIDGVDDFLDSCND
jgi:N-acetylmuramoyl-L-alanine amidase